MTVPDRASGAFVILLSFMVSVTLLMGCDSNKGPTLRQGSALPHVSLASTDGRTLSIPEDFRGKLTVLLFWSKGCPFCKKEMPLIEPLYQKYRDRGFTFVAVHMGPGMDAARSMQADMGLSFPQLVDEDSRLRKHYGIVSVPTMFVLDDNGILREKILGGLGAGDLEKMILETL